MRRVRSSRTTCAPTRLPSEILKHEPRCDRLWRKGSSSIWQPDNALQSALRTTKEKPSSSRPAEWDLPDMRVVDQRSPRRYLEHFTLRGRPFSRSHVEQLTRILPSAADDDLTWAAGPCARHGLWRALALHQWGTDQLAVADKHCGQVAAGSLPTASRRP
jgi:hypothetical protein